MKNPVRMLNSGLMVGTVWHKRYAPRRHGFSYQVFYGLFDLDEFSDLDRRSWVFGVDRAALFSIHQTDYGLKPGQNGKGLKKRIAGLIKQQYGDEIKRVELLTMPKVLGYAFNPISVYYCYAENGLISHVIYEVNNTFGERFSYAFSVEEESGKLTSHGCEKHLHVSPFFDVSGGYRFRQDKNTKAIRLTVDYRSGAQNCEPESASLQALETAERTRDQKTFTASMSLNKKVFSSRNLLRISARIPFVTLKVMAAIHWQALLLWLKKHRIFRKPSGPEISVGAEGKFKEGQQA